MNTAEYIIKKLEELGIVDFFGLPGNYNLGIVSLINKKSSIKWIGCTNAQNAGFSADGYARVIGYGAVVISGGADELSSVSAVAGSFAENIPVCYLVGLSSDNDAKNNFLDIYKNVTAASIVLNRDNAKFEIDRILKIMVKERKPVYIALPEDVAELDISERFVLTGWESNKENLNLVVKLISDKINNSEKPFILVDSVINKFGSKAEFAEFLKKTQIPCANFPSGVGIVNSEYINYLGTFCENEDNSLTAEFMRNTDCLISFLIDFSGSETDLQKKYKKGVDICGTCVFIDGKRYDSVRISDVLMSLTELTNKKEINIEQPVLETESIVPENDTLTSEYIYSRLQSYFKENDIIFVETGAVSKEILKLKFPDNVNINFQQNWNRTGWATPAAFGAGCAKKDARIVLITGDGAHQQTFAEIGNMMRYGVKPVIIVINNSGYSGQRFLCGDTNAKFNDIVQINYTKLVRAFEGDIWTAKLSSKSEFDKALNVTRIMNRICYIEACIDKFDVPESVKIPSSNKAGVNDDVLTDLLEEKDQYSEGEDTSEKYSYETTVHKSLGEKQ